MFKTGDETVWQSIQVSQTVWYGNTCTPHKTWLVSHWGNTWQLKLITSTYLFIELLRYHNDFSIYSNITCICLNQLIKCCLRSVNVIWTSLQFQIWYWYVLVSLNSTENNKVCTWFQYRSSVLHPFKTQTNAWWPVVENHELAEFTLKCGWIYTEFKNYFFHVQGSNQK